MPIRNPVDLAGELPSGRRILGFDVGEKTVGLAISDGALTIASPLETLPRGRFADVVAQLERIVRDREVGAFVVGLPLNMDGSEGPRCEATRQFARNLLERIDLPLAFWDERLSTVAVERAMIAADMTRKRRAAAIDRAAAAYILQGALDAIRAAQARARIAAADAERDRHG